MVHYQKRFLKIFLTISIVSAIFVFFFFLSTPDSEAVVTQALSPISCVSGSLLGSALAPEIEKMMNNGINFVSTKLGKILKKTVCERDDAGQCIAKVLGIGGKVPVDDDDTQSKVDSFKNTWRSKENAGDIIARCAAREVLNVMVGNVLNVARTSGRDDGPAWVRNWRNFQTDAQYRGEGMFRAVLSNTKLCDYFNDDVKSLFGATQKVSLTGKQNTRINNFDPFALRANCTMPSNFNLTNYQKDFSGNGGWQAFSRMLEPQNNYYGTLFASLDEAAKQRALEESTDINEAVSGAGFTSRRGDSVQDNCEQTDDMGKCIAYKIIKTPASIISESVAATMQQELAWITNVDELSEVIQAATNLIFNRLLDLGNPNEGPTGFFTEPTFPMDTPVNSETCPAPSTPATLCENVDSTTVLNILNKYSPSNVGIMEAIEEVRGVYPDAYVIPHDTGSRALDKIDFGGGLIVDVIEGAVAEGEGVRWMWGIDCPCGGGGGGEENPPPEPAF